MKLQQIYAEADKRIQLSAIKPDINDTCKKCKTMQPL